MLGRVEIKNRQKEKIKSIGNPTPEVTAAHSSVDVRQAHGIYPQTHALPFPKQGHREHSVYNMPFHLAILSACCLLPSPFSARDSEWRISLAPVFLSHSVSNMTADAVDCAFMTDPEFCHSFNPGPRHPQNIAISS